MKKIEAIIRPRRLDTVREALQEIGITGMTFTEVKGAGRQKGYAEIYRGIEYKIDLLPKLKLEIVLEDDMLDECVQLLLDASRTGQIGDGKIFISTIEKVIRIRTGDMDKEAV